MAPGPFKQQTWPRRLTRGVIRRIALIAALAVVACCVSAPAALAFGQVTGSPFTIGSDPDSVAFSPGGGLLATASYFPDTVSVFSVGAGGALTQVTGSPFTTGSGPQSVAFSPSGGLLAAANYGDGTVSVFSVGAGGALAQVTGSAFGPTGSGPYSVAFSPDGGLLAIANFGGNTVSVFSVGAGGALTQVAGSPFPTGSLPESVAFSPSGGLLATANENDSTVSVFSVGAGGALTQVAGSPFPTDTAPASVAFSPGGGLLATANAGGFGFAGGNTVSVFSVDAGGALTQVTGSPFTTGSGPVSVAFSPDGGLLATANSGDYTVSVFSVGAGGALTQVTGSPLPTGSAPYSGAFRVAFSPDGGLLATANLGDSTVSVFSTAVSAPSASIGSPADGQTYGLDQVVGTSFSCSEGSGGPGIESCTDSNGLSGGSGALDTSTIGTFSYTVTATSTDGQTGTASISYTVVGPPPSASISSPADGGTYNLNQVVATSFSCSEGSGAPGIQSCTDSNGSTSPGTLDTSTAGTFSYTVTATDADGQTGTTSISYVVAPPSASISSPADGGTYNLNQVVATSFSCSEGSGAPGIQSCTDSNGGTSPGALDTSTPGPNEYTVTATSQDGLTGTATISYDVVGPPHVLIIQPADGQTFSLNESVRTNFACDDHTGRLDPGIQSCTDSNGASANNGSGFSSGFGALDTSTVGTFTYRVTATSRDGQTATASISYTVVGPPSASISSPANGGTYNLNEGVSTSFSCSDASDGPGIRSCTDSNGALGGSGALDTSTPGPNEYTVTATSLTGGTGRASISYTVVGPPSASISSPANGGTYNLNEGVSTSFSCSDASDGPGIQSCTDSNGASGGSGALDTSTAGTFSYTVTAMSSDGQTATASISYTVVGPPSASISSPAGGQTYDLDQSVATSFSCSEGSGAPGIQSCTDSNGTTSPGALDTSTAGTFTYTVTATSEDGQTGTASISYTVAGPPSAQISSPADGQTYDLDQVVATSFSCSKGSGGPGIQSCTDSNGSTSPGTLDTSTAGTFSYTVTATSEDGLATTASVSYTVLSTGQVLGSPFPTGSAPSSVAFSPDGRLLATANQSDNTVSVFSVGGDGALTPVAGSPFPTGSAPSSVAFSPDGRLLATANQSDNTVSVFSVGGDGALTPVAGSPFPTGSAPSSVAFSPDGSLLATANQSDNTVSVFSVGGDGALTPVAGSPFPTGSAPSSVVFSPDGSLLATANQSDNTVSVFSVGGDGALTPVAGSPFPTGSAPASVAFSPDGSLLATANSASVSVFSVAVGGVLTPVAGSPFPTGSDPYSVAFSPDGGLLATGNGASVSVFSVAPGGVLTPVDGSPFPTGSASPSVAFSPGGGLLATANPATFGAVSSVSVFSVGSPTPVGPPSTSIIHPADGQTFNLDQSVATAFSCSDPASGPWIESCIDSNGASSGTGLLDTSTAGAHAYTVTAISKDGQTGTATIRYTVAGPPSAAITKPAGGGTYGVGQVVATSFSCSESTDGAGLSTCLDSNGSSSPGTLNTSTAGPRSYTVTATSTDGQTGIATIRYTVAGPPSASISKPAGGGSYGVGQVVATSFSCSESTNGPGLSTCRDSNGSSSPGVLDTSTAGPHAYTVTATSKDGQTGTASFSYTVVGPPSASIGSPAGGGTYGVGQVVPTSFSCSESANGPGIQSCKDSNGATSPTGALSTSTVGPHTYSVTAISKDGQTGTATIHYTVAGPPSAAITKPAGGGTYGVGQVVATSFSCSESTDGAGLSTCLDSNGSSSPGTLNTSTAGPRSYTVTATSTDGQTGTATIRYTVAGPPSASISKPAGGGSYGVGQVVATSFSCSESTNGPGLSTCRDSNGSSSPGVLDTSTAGPHAYTVTATSKDGQTGTASFSYTVVGPPSASIGSPAGGGTYGVGQVVPTSFSCSESANGPGIQSCKDSNGATSPTGALSTSTVGPHTYSVTAISKDGQTGTATIHYTVAGPPSASITKPAGGGSYAFGQVVATSFSCSESANGPGIQSCKDSNGATSPTGALSTSTVGSHTYAVTATSKDGQTATASISYTVVKATPTVSWTPPGSITYGTPLTAVQLDASSPVAGSFTYNPSSGIVLQPGIQTLTATFSPADTAHYTAVSVSRQITVGFSQPCITTAKTAAFNIASGQSICVTSGGSLSGPVTVTSGGALWMSGGKISAPLSSNRALALTLCGTTTTGAITITGSTGYVLVGGVGCSGNTLGAPVQITNNTGGVGFSGNKVTGPLTITGNSGGFTYSGNTVSGPATVSGNR